MLDSNDQTPYGTDATTTAWDGFEPAATDSDLHGGTSLFRDPVGAVAYQDGASGGEWVLGDQRNATATADASGQITDLVNYADFGGAEYESTGWASLVGNDQQPGDPTLGLDNYYARDYDPTTGSWVQPDDWRGLLVRPQSLNRYSYIENTPVSFSDDLGYVIKMMRPRDFGGGFAKRLVRHAFTKATAAKSVVNLNRHVARDSMSKPKSFGKKLIPQAPRNRSASFTSATHMDKCSVFELLCNRTGGRDTVYCSDNILGTIAPVTCTMDYRPETVAAKAIDVLLSGAPVGWILSRGLQLLLRAKSAAPAARIIVVGAPNVDNVARVPTESVEVIRSIQSTGVIAQSGVKGPAVPKPFLNDGRGGGQLLPQFDKAGNPITYREWGTVPNSGNVKPGGERIVTGSDGSIYYTPDHYQSFVRWTG